MKFLRNLMRKAIFADLDTFSQSLGYSTWDEMKENTFYIFTIPPDAELFVTQLHDKTWAVWDNEGKPPFDVTKFTTWDEAIRFSERRKRNDD